MSLTQAKTICTECAKEMEGIVNFCPFCGKKQLPRCISCSAPYKPGYQYCPNCGESVQSAAQPQKQEEALPAALEPEIEPAEKNQLESKRTVTVLFSDIKDYTKFSAEIDPETLKKILDRAYRVFYDSVLEHGGTVDKFMGDAVLAVFGVPISYEDNAARAIETSLKIKQGIERIAQDLNLKKPIQVKTGIATGIVVVSHIGEEKKYDYTVIGDTVNMASRIEDFAAPGELYVNEATYQKVSSFYEFQCLPNKKIKGKEGEFPVYKFLRKKVRHEERKYLSDFIGREEEFLLVRKQLAKSKTGAPNFAGISGPAGVGKSRFVFESLRKLLQEEKDLAFYKVSTRSYQKTVPYILLKKISLAFLGLPDDAGTEEIQHQLRETFLQFEDGKSYLQTLAPIFGVGKESADGDQSLGGEKKKANIFKAVSFLLEQKSKAGAQVIVIEDLHWADPISVEFIHYLMKNLKLQSLLTILTFRDGFKHEFTTNKSYTQLAISSLLEEECRRMSQSFLKVRSLPKELETLVWTKSTGNPLYVEQILISLLENEFIEVRNGTVQVLKDFKSLKIPETIEGIILAHIDTLRPVQIKMLRAASIEGRYFTYRYLKELYPAENFDSLLEEFIKEDILFETPNRRERTFVFRHALIQEAIYNNMLMDEKKALHENLAKIIERESENSAHPENYYELLALHYDLSENLPKTIDYLLKVARKAASIYSLDLIFESCEKALKYALKTQDFKSAFESYIKLGSANHNTGKSKEAVENCEKAIELASQMNDPHCLAEGYLRKGDALKRLGKFAEATECFTKGIEFARKTTDIEIQVMAMHRLSARYFFEDRQDEAQSILKEALELSRKANYEKGIHYALSELATTEERKLNFNGALQYLREALEIVAKNNLKTSIGFYTNRIGRIYIRLGNYEEAYKMLQESYEVAHSIGNQAHQCWILLSLCELYMIAGNLQKALETADEGMEKSKKLEYKYLIGSFLQRSASIKRRLGHYMQAKEDINNALIIARESKEKSTTALYLYESAIILRDMGSADEAEKRLLEAEKLSHGLDMKLEGMIALTLGNIKFRRAESAEARQLLEKSLRLRQESKMIEGEIISSIALAEFWLEHAGREQARNYIQNAFEKAIAIDNRDQLPLIYILLSRVAFSERDNENSEKYAKIAIDHCRQYNYKKFLAYSLTQKAYQDCLAKNYERGRVESLEAVEICKQIGEKYDIYVRAMHTYGDALEKLGQLDEALHVLSEAADVAEKAGLFRPLGRIYFVIALIYQKKENFNKADEFYKKSIERYDRGVEAMDEETRKIYLSSNRINVTKWYERFLEIRKEKEKVADGKEQENTAGG